jgi:hypothetical protein
VYDGPMLKYPLSVTTGETVVRDRFIFTDLISLPAAGNHSTLKATPAVESR